MGTTRHLNHDRQSLASSNETPPDLAAIRADDALLDSIISPVVITNDALARALYAWHREAVTVPTGVLVDTTTALRAIASGTPRRSGPWVGLLLAVAVSAAWFAVLAAVVWLVTR